MPNSFRFSSFVLHPSSFLLCLFLTGLPALAHGQTTSPGSNRLILRSGRFAVVLDAQSGGLAELRWDDKPLTQPLGTVPPLDIKQDDAWILGSGRVKAKLLDVARPGPGMAVATLAAGDWQIELHYELDASWPMLTRWARLKWSGQQPTKLKGFWLGTPPFQISPRPRAGEGPGVRAADSDQSYYYFPGVYPPQRYPADAFRDGARHSTSQSLSPVIAQLSPQRSVLWICDELTAASDHTSATVTETPGGFRVAQHINAQGRVRPGDVQEIGSAALWLIEGDGETALRRIHDWMRKRGHVPPADRPEWFRDAVIYSFHPGGTTGSGFRDLGGFRAATKLLDHIAALGCNTIWIMPIEDAGPYYKFQEGLGTADDYRVLVARAHQLGLHVLQDCVPHGGRNDSPRARAHPEWLAQEENGSTLSYWCNDFNWPSWQQYMAGVARHYVTQFGVDGYRVDAVGGSKIVNWNPAIPYARASFAQLQGGLGMLHALRAAVKREKPDGALLAEVQGSVYGTAADAVYDFTACYQAFHDVRKMPAEEFVPRLRRWLHEQHYAETPGLLRLRHVESHDSLRAELWYGPEPMRALMALTAWIDGIPLVYHEMENGHEAEFRRIFDIRKALPELRRGDVDYLSVEAPPGVFACLRSDGEGASIVLINFGHDAAVGEIRVPLACLPYHLRSAPRVFVPSGPGFRSEITGNLASGNRVLSIPLGGGINQAYVLPLSFTVCAVRSGQSTLNIPFHLWPRDEPRDEAANRGEPPIRVRDNEDVVELRDAGPGMPCRLSIGRKTGLPESLEGGGQRLLGPADVFLPEKYRRMATEAVFRREGKELVFERSFGSARLEMRYKDVAGAIRIHSRWVGTDIPENASLTLPVVGAWRWEAYATDGGLMSFYRVRHPAFEGAAGSIYWRPQGTNVLWDSLFHPLLPIPITESTVLAATTVGGGVFSAVLSPEMIPARVQLVDRNGDCRELTAIVAWRDRSAPATPHSPSFELTLYTLDNGDCTNDMPLDDMEIGRSPGGWTLGNDYYSLRLSRSGLITQLYAKKGGQNDAIPSGPRSTLTPGPSPDQTSVGTRGRGEKLRLIVDNTDLYTDHGFGSGKTVYGASNEVEAASRMWKDDEGHLRFRFEGRLRGSYRFDLLKPPLEYFFDYTLDEHSPSFRMSWGIRPHAPPVGKSAFLGLLMPVPEIRNASYYLGGKLVGGTGSSGRVGQGRADSRWGSQTATNADQPLLPEQHETRDRSPTNAAVRSTHPTNHPHGRDWQFQSLGPGVVPDRIELAGEEAPLLRISDLRCGGVPLSNGFVNGKQFFLTFYDGRPSAEGQGQWRWASAVLTPGAARPTAIGGLPPPPAPAQQIAILEDPGFEAAAESTPVSLRTGQPLPGYVVESAWLIPPGGRLVSSPVHSGQAAAEVVNTTGQYALWRQPLLAARFAPGTRWRLSAWVKGEAIQRGDAPWKVGVLRFSVAGGPNKYVGSSPLLGTFPWRQVSVDLTIPAAIEGLGVEIGLNGATGKMWIDDVELKPLN